MARDRSATLAATGRERKDAPTSPRGPVATTTPAPGSPLEEAVESLPRIGPRRAAQLARLDIATVGDLLHHLPRRYVERPATRSIHELEPGQPGAVEGVVNATRIRRHPRRRGDLVARITDGTGSITCVWFGQPYLEKQLAGGTRVRVWGMVTAGTPPVMRSPEIELVAEGERGGTGAGRIPVYALTAAVSQRRLRGWIHSALERLPPDGVEPLERHWLEELALPPLPTALRILHTPEPGDDLERARRRLVFGELLELALCLGFLRRGRVEGQRRVPETPGPVEERTRRALPFVLTAAQESVFQQVRADMRSTGAMQRLLEGDVGSGKTVVALLAAAAAADLGQQTALMVPTELLAYQHLRTAARLAPGLRTTLLTARATGAGEDLATRRQRLDRVESGDVDLVIGTHALLGTAVRFARLGLVVIDEQHRFGVGQRAALHAKGAHPDLLLMTATPIPRSLALVVARELDVSVLEELPPGRRLARVHLAGHPDRDRVDAYLDRRIGAGGQVVVVAPRIGAAAGDPERLAAESCLARLRAHPVLGRRRIDLLHGRLPAARRLAVVERLRRGEIDLLVSTTVVEVGLDHPGITTVVIEEPERFGLSQLHQLRGRAGRGGGDATCILQLGPTTPEETRRRLRRFARSTDGFEVAMLDLETRGVGELIGLRQHGWDGLRVADLRRDLGLFETSRRLARRILETDPGLRRHPGLRRRLVVRWGVDPRLASCSEARSV